MTNYANTVDVMVHRPTTFINYVTRLPPQVDRRGPECFLIPSAERLCDAPATRYYFDQQKSECIAFYGCQSLQHFKNNFDNLNHCVERCNSGKKSSSIVQIGL